MTTDELRATFLSFFGEKGHTVVQSSSLIPRGDPTLLLTSAGMVQFKPYFLGEAIPPNRRLTSCQKCFRTTDIEAVGDSNHLTFFEMLGNFSIGDYFKREAISWAKEFVIDRLKLPTERLWITIFLDDDEAFRYWREIGVDEHRILRFGEQDNFWGPAGDSGPCGPCSEIVYDFGEEFSCGRPSCTPGCDCGRYSEIWNLVFTQYNQDVHGKRTLLQRPNIDTGMGLERTAAVIQGKTTVYETDVFATLLENVSRLASKKYGSSQETDRAIRVIAEHSRGITILIGDGVIPSNEGPGYVLRRLLRRTALFGQRLGLYEPFLAEPAKKTIEVMGRVYPEIVQRQDFIIKVIESEEARFTETLDIGLELLDRIMAKSGGSEKRISGEDAFVLYDTYGFPVEITNEIAAGRGFSVDLDGFREEMAKQRQRARAGAKNKTRVSSERRLIAGLQPTRFVGYHKLRQESVILSFLIHGKATDRIEPGNEVGIILETTPFYGEMGGQVGDSGKILGTSGQFLVTNTDRLTPDVIVHRGRVTGGYLTVGDEVEAVVDEERRLDIARNHTATHLLQFALRIVLGEHVQQRGSLVAPDRLRFDFSHLVAVTKDELHQVEHMVNERIRQNLIIYDEEVPYKKAIEDGAIALFDEKYGDIVRVKKIGEPAISAELCGGTHVIYTGEIGYFHIINESSIGTGLRRIEAITGRAAEEFFEQHLSELWEIAEQLGVEVDNVVDKIRSLTAEFKNERRQRLAIERILTEKTAESLLAQAEVIKGVTVLRAKVPSSRIEVLREMSDLLKEQLKSGIIVLGSIYDDKPVFLAAVTPDLISKGYDAGKIVKRVAAITGGGGGGKASLAQAGGRHNDKIDEALQLVKSLV